MKKLLLATLLLLCFVNYGQVKRESLIEDKNGKINFTYQKTTDIEKNEIRYMVYLGFQNEKYTSISDLKSVTFFDQESLNEFIKDLNVAKAQMLLKEKVNLNWDKKNYSLVLYDFSYGLYLKNTKGVEGYTILDIKAVDKLIENVSKIDFGKDILIDSTKK